MKTSTLIKHTSKWQQQQQQQQQQQPQQQQENITTRSAWKPTSKSQLEKSQQTNGTNETKLGTTMGTTTLETIEIKNGTTTTPRMEKPNGTADGTTTGT